MDYYDKYNSNEKQNIDKLSFWIKAMIAYRGYIMAFILYSRKDGTYISTFHSPLKHKNS